MSGTTSSRWYLSETFHTSADKSIQKLDLTSLKKKVVSVVSAKTKPDL